MDYERESAVISDIKNYISQNFPLSDMSDEGLAEKVEEIVAQNQAIVFI